MMDDSKDSCSEASDTLLEYLDEDELPQSAYKTIVDDAIGIDDFLANEGSVAPLTLDDGSPSIKPRPYQLEMLEESLKRNIIVAVSC